MIAKPGKPPNEISSYRPISLLPILSKLLEKLFLNRLKPIIARDNLIPSHQFGFRGHHSAVDHFACLGSIITADSDTDMDTENRINKDRADHWM